MLYAHTHVHTFPVAALTKAELQKYVVAAEKSASAILTLTLSRAVTEVQDRLDELADAHISQNINVMRVSSLMKRLDTISNMTNMRTREAKLIKLSVANRNSRKSCGLLSRALDRESGLIWAELYALLITKGMEQQHLDEALAKARAQKEMELHTGIRWREVWCIVRFARLAAAFPALICLHNRALREIVTLEKALKELAPTDVEWATLQTDPLTSFATTVTTRVSPLTACAPVSHAAPVAGAGAGAGAAGALVPASAFNMRAMAAVVDASSDGSSHYELDDDFGLD